MSIASQKKVKPSFVCLRCKQRKIKCDKLWPTCSKCKASSSICSYEVEPGRINKSPTIENAPHRNIRNITPASMSASGSFTSILNPNTKDWEMKNFAMNLSNAHDKLVVMNNTTIVDSPFAFHSILQHDLYAKALTTCIHGRMLIDVERHRENVSANNKKRELNLTIGDIGPLFFIDKAALKFIENTSKTSKLYPPIDFLYNTYDYEQAHPEENNDKISINILLEELSKYFLNKNEVDGLIVDFYKTIYPVYPLLEISLFEDNIRELLQLNEFNGYNIVFAGKDSRRKLETITLLTIILAFSYRRLSLSTSHSFKESFGVNSNNLTLLAHKLLALMNVFQYVNEHTLCCLLYFFILRYLNPDQADMYPTHSDILNLKFLENVAIKLGLNEEPFQYTRYVSESDDYPRLFNLRRKLWLGVQFLKFGILIPEGDSDILSLEYLRSFMKTDESLPELFERNYASTNNLDLSLMATAENIYHLHLSLQVLLTSCFPINGPSYLKEVLDNIDKTKDFLKSEIPSHFKFSWRTKDEELTYQCSLFLSK
ncbi:Regulator of drug sensitivity 1 [Saccharomyces cerevisiae]|nr:Regulator of drug sensitivity 1 [Saccharomyces cerevisiae]